MSLFGSHKYFEDAEAEPSAGFDPLRLLEHNSNLILVAPSGQILSSIKSALMALPRTRIGIIDPDFPFLSNLNMSENIVLSDMYRHRLPFGTSMKKIGPHIAALNMNKAMNMRKELLSREEMLKCHVLRCISSNNQAIFMEYPKIWELNFILQCLKESKVGIHVWISCHHKSLHTYSGIEFEQINIAAD